MFVFSLILFVISSCCCYAHRDLNFIENPNCLKNCNKPWLVYGKGITPNNTLHYLWGAEKLPTYVIVLTAPDVSLNIDWDKFQDGEAKSLHFSLQPLDTFGVSFQTLILFDDVNDTGKIDNIPEDSKQYISLSEFEWTITAFSNTSMHEQRTEFTTTSFRNKLLDSSKIIISVTSFGKEGRGSALPNLLATSQSVQIEITLKDLILDLVSLSSHGKGAIPISGFTNPRWAFDVIFVSDDKKAKEGLVLDSHKSLDDEHTPGVFSICTITSFAARNLPQKDLTGATSFGGFVQWRPVAYLNTNRDVNQATVPSVNKSLPKVDEDHLNATEDSLLYALFGQEVKSMVTAQTPIAFGKPDDKFYTAFNYTVWTFTMGLGSPPNESFSTLLIVVISVAVGIPVLLFLLGGVAIGMRRCRHRGDLLITEEEY